MIKPILFNTDMVRAILDERKMVTRRALKYPFTVHPNGYITKPKGDENICPYEPPYRPGDCLYVRETWQECCMYTVHSPIVHNKYCFKASEDSAFYGCIEDCGKICKWHPSIHMPKEAARIWLKVTDVRVERLQECEKGWCVEIEKEGVITPQSPILYINDDKFHEALKEEFQKLWNSTIKKPDLARYGWDANPYVWVIEFERCEKPDSCIKKK